MKRRGFLRALLAAAGGAIGVGTWLFWKNNLGRPRRRPNIIFILADDLGYGDLGSYGQERIQTPNLDAMAAQGMRFTQCYAGSSVCAPSRGVLMTGLHTGHARIRGNVSYNFRYVSLRDKDFTVSELLKSAGYVTGAIGKWSLGDRKTSGTPNKKGFDEWFGNLNQDRASNYYPKFLWRNEEKIEIEGNQNGRKEVYSHDLFTQEALNFIQAHQEEPFFLYLAYAIPHSNDDLYAETGNGLEVPDDEPYSGESWPQVEKNFAAMVTKMDRDVGRILSLLRKLRLHRDTIVFFSSDNGPHVEGGHDHEFFQSAGPLRGRKRDLYEGGIRVPTIAWWPGTIKRGTVSDEVWAFWDFLPTAAELGEATLPEDVEFDGISIVPALLGKPQQAHDFLYWEHMRVGSLTFEQAVRMGKWKGIQLGKDADVELYDLESDIGESHDVAADHQDIVARIAEIMRTEHTPSDKFPTDPDRWGLKSKDDEE